MSIFERHSACLAVCLVLISSGLADGWPVDLNLVGNPSFELAKLQSTLPSGWSGPVPVYSIDRDVHRTGSASLKYVNPDAGRYCLASQKVDLLPGRKYRFSVWVKTAEIAGAESGATICLEWRGKDGKWLGGQYPTGVRGTADWTRVEGAARLPEDATSVSLLCYVRQTMTGTAWFDDVELVQVVDPPMRTIMLSPGYRGRLLEPDSNRVRLRVRLNLTDYEVAPQTLRADVRVRDTSLQRVVGHAGAQPGENGDEPTDVVVPIDELSAGDYDIETRLLDADGKVLQTTHHPLSRPPAGFRPKSVIDAHRRLLIDGEPFFPIGMYWSGINEKDVKVYAQSKFNCLMAYGSPSGEQMDLAHQHGLKVIYSIKDWYVGSKYCPPSIESLEKEEKAVRERVRKYRGHPALLAWYLNDELPQSFMEQLESHQRWVSEEDPDHPTWVVLYQYRDVAAYLNTFDVIGTDPYPIGRRSASMAAEWTAETFRQVEGARPMWQVPQLHNWANYRKTAEERKGCHTPTFDEIRSMAWQCIAEGATGLVFYSWFDVKRNPDVTFDSQWEGLKRVAAEIDRMAPILLSTETVPEVTVLYAKPAADEVGWLHHLVRSHGGNLYVFAVNDGDGAGGVNFTLPKSAKAVRVLGEERSIELRGSSFQDQFDRLDVRVYEIGLSGR